MKYWLRKTVCAVAAGAVTLGAVAARPAAAATPTQVNEAIEKAQGYILSQMKGGNWENGPPPDFTKKEETGQADPNGRQYGGTTALAVYGLLATGMTTKDPKLVPAIEWLKTAPMGGHYACAMRAQVWTFMRDENESKLASKPDFSILLNALISEGGDKGLYSYYTDLATKKIQSNWSDHSVSQFGVLGVWACEQAGQEVPSIYWEIVDKKWKTDQLADGGWNYNKGKANGSGGSTATMTNAGVATLFITQDYLLQSNKWDRCAGGTRSEHIERGLAWIDKNIQNTLGGGSEHHFYALYGIERIGVASGRKYFGTVDWYKVGAEDLINGKHKQNANGSWGVTQGTHNPKGVADTVFATLFLVRGRAPVVMNKLQYTNGGEPAATPAKEKDGKDAKPAPAPVASGRKGQEEPWNERPRDSANFVHWAGRQTEHYLNWQIVNLRVPSSELHDAPILYIAGSEPLNFNDAEVTKLREFAEDGGMILFNADCGSQAFTTSVSGPNGLTKKLFPKYEFRELPANHPIYTDEQFRPTKWRFKPRVMGLSNGVRELVIMIPDADLGRWWQTRSEKTKQEMYELTQNIFLYAVDKQSFHWRGETYAVTPDAKINAEHEVKVARVTAGDNPDPEPGGWRRLGNLLHNQYKLGVKLDAVKLGEGKLTEYKVAHFTGTAKFNLSADQVKDLKDFIAGGGTLIVDSAGGATEFADSAEKLLAGMFNVSPENLGTVMEPTDKMFAEPKIEKFEYRPFVRGKLAGKLNVPRLRTIEVNGRTAVYYSREDLTAGLVGEPVDGILGYEPETATAIMRNLVLHAGGQAAAPPVAAKPKPDAATPAPKKSSGDTAKKPGTPKAGTPTASKK